jgi:hypothetical protein
MVYNCYPDEKDGLVLVYSRQKCTNSKLVLFTTLAISTVVILKRAWRWLGMENDCLNYFSREKERNESHALESSISYIGQP